MAVSDAVRRTGSLLLRAVTVGGIGAAAWLLWAGGAAAQGEDHPNEVPMTLDAVNVAIDQQHTATAELVAAVLAEYVPETPPIAPVPLPPAVTIPVEPDEFAGQSADNSWSSSTDSTSDTTWGSSSGTYSGGSYSGGTESTRHDHTGAVSNTMPTPMYEAKVAAKAAARQAAQPATPDPEPAAAPPAPTTPQAATPLPQPVTPPPPVLSTPLDQPTPGNLTWENPEPRAPAPAPKQAPAPTAPTTASSSGYDSSNGHRGGVIASVTGQSRLTAPTVWSVEQRDDGQTPGSVQGLPSTSPD